ncbi:probable E3 ubiquitin-protein ligase MGRN1 isoform X1 [Sinocyclocheilus rhinocerous]|uniref:probable E3 ubiquitin-protein ligase MGRN1 isoform X1 n=1 Tax=Sinocyclocheilus rhinocerous TaxID=307959 RepID=UPI0007B9C9A2|nr:PREDICTED: probable E3 ubiquitin-protein ligase MGRN1 isoform X1 [Sinocyclocheilus rhinocerous]XP_016397972.1 PREDICTED: probable E3 ubiquitin-protein ligase MGRN1 isoform X1 [Sinocyclocheilus rhinocerous]
MGSILSRRIAGVEDIDIQANSAYRYPPKSGNYFTSHFFMGGEKFDTPHPEGYLFGENMDLNFLGNRPVQFPYVTPAPHEPVKTLRSLVNIRKDSLRLVRYKDDSDSTPEDTEDPILLYSVEFCFDTDARVAITLYCQAFEEFTNGMAIYSPKSPSMVSETVHYKRGINQQFSLPSFKIDFTKWNPEELNFDLDKGVFPLVVQAIVDDGDDVTGHAHVLLAAFERHVDGSFSVKPLKQKQIVDRVSYLLQEIYGIENRNNQETKPTEDENSDNSSECVVCLSDLRDTIILPCRHLCLCNACADTLRYQANNCPICRLPFRALLQIRAVRKKTAATLSPVSFSPVLSQSSEHTEHLNADNIPPGYEPISLLEALNGVQPMSPSIPSAPLYEEIQFSGEMGDPLNLTGLQQSAETTSMKGKASKSPDRSTRSPSSPIREEEDEERMSELSDAQPQSVLPCSLSPTEQATVEGVSTKPGFPNSGSESRSLGVSVSEILQDCRSERSSLSRTESDPSADLALPGSSESIESLKSQSTSSSSQPLLCLPSTLRMEDERLTS